MLYAEITSGARAADQSRSPITDDHGRLVGPFNAMLVNPAVGGPMQALGAAIRYRTSLSEKYREIATLVVAAMLDCGFERFAHEPLARAAGVSDETIDAIAAGCRPTDLDPGAGLVLRSTQSLVERGDLGDAEFLELQAALGTAGCVELVALVGYYRMLALLLATFRVSIPGA